MFGSIVSACCRYKHFVAKAIDILGLGPWGYWRSDAGVNGKLAADLNGTTDELTISDDTFTTSNGSADESFSIMAWVRRDSSATFPICTLETNASDFEYSFYLGSSSTGPRFRITDGGIGNRNTKVSADDITDTTNFHQVVATYDGANVGVDDPVDHIKIYIDGAEVTYDADDITGTYVAMSGAINQLRIGQAQWASSFADGKIDQFVFFKSYVLTSQDVTDLYNSGNGLKDGDLAGTENFYNSSRADNGGAWYDFDTPARPGRESSQEVHGVSFKSGVTYLKDPDNTSINFGSASGDKPFSAGCWIQFGTLPSSAGFSRSIMGRGTNSDGDLEWCLVYNGGDKGIVLFLCDGSAFVNYIRFYVTNATLGLVVDTWYHLGFTYNGDESSPVVDFYLNGVKFTGIAGTSGGSYSTNPMPNGGTQQFMIGGNLIHNQIPDTIVDEAFVYSGVVTDAEWATLYYGGTVAEASTLLITGSDATNPASLVESYSFNGQTVATVGTATYGSSDLTDTNLAEADLVGGKDSLDLIPTGITSADFVGGQVVGKVINEENVFSKSDTSGNSNDFEQAAVGDQPIGIEDGFGTGESLQHWHDGTKNYLKTNTSPYWSGDWAVAVAVKVLTTPTGTEYVMSQWGATDKMWGIRVTSGGEIRVAISNDGTAATFTTGFSFTEDTWYVYVATHEDGVEIAHYVYDTTGTLLDSDVVAHTTGMHDGSGVNELILGGSDNNKFDGETADAVAFQKVLTEAERTTVVNEILTNVGLIS